MFVHGMQERQKQDVASAILTGYYSAYYNNGGKKVKKPHELIQSLYTKKQSFEEGLKDIERLKKAEEKLKKEDKK